MTKKTKKLTQEQEGWKKKRRGLIAGLLLLGATTATGVGLTVYYATKPVIQTYTVTIKNVEGATIYGGTTQKVMAGTLIGQLPTPFKKDMVFVNWQTGSKRDISNNKPINEDMIIYAAWETPTLDAHTVTFELNGGTLPGISGNSIKVNDGTLVGKLPSPVKNGYVFDKWQILGVDLPFETPIITSITITAIYKEVGASATLDGGSRLLEIKTNSSGSDTKKWVLKDKGGSPLTGADWYITDKSGAAIPGLSIADGVVSWTNVAKNSYTAVITAEKQDTTASTEIGIVVTDHVYTLSNGSTQSAAKFGIGGEAKGWTLSKDGTEITTGITWSVTKADGSKCDETITVSSGKLTWTAATPIGNYDLKIHATYDSKEVATTNVGLIISENAYTLEGGSRGFNVKPSGPDVTDTKTWVLTKDGSTLASPTLSIKDITPSITSPASISITDGKVKISKLPENSYTFNVVATDNGKDVIKQQVSVVSTEEYSIDYGTSASPSLTIKDNAAATDSNGFSLKNSAGTALTTGVTWELTKPSSLTDAQLKLGTDANANKLVYANVPTGTYNLTITGKLNGTAKAVIAFTLVSQDTKISIVINGPDVMNPADSLTAQYTTNISDPTRLKFDMGTWSGESTIKFDMSVDVSTGVATLKIAGITGQNISGILTLKVMDGISGQTGTKDITINNPYVGTNKVFTYDATNQWCSIPMSDLTGTGTITKTKLIDDGTKVEPIERNAFNDPIFIGDNITSIPDNFLNGCTSFNSDITFTTESKCMVIGNNFMSGCTAFNKTLALPSTVQIIGDSFLEGCTAFNNGQTGGTPVPFTMPSALTNIGDMFFYNCQAFNQTITIANTVTSVGNDFMYNCYAMVSTITINTSALNFKATGATPLTLACDDYTKQCYNTGITIAGSVDLTQFKQLFPAITATTTGVVCRNYKAS